MVGIFRKVVHLTHRHPLVLPGATRMNLPRLPLLLALVGLPVVASCNLDDAAKADDSPVATCTGPMADAGPDQSVSPAWRPSTTTKSLPTPCIFVKGSLFGILAPFPGMC